MLPPRAGSASLAHTLMANMRKLSALALLPLLAVGVFAQTATTDPVGFVKLTQLAGSDTIVSAPLERAPEFRGVVASVSGEIIAVQGTTGWTADQFLYSPSVQPKTYYVRFLSGARAGAYFTVLGNTTSALTIDLNGDSLSTVAAGDKLQITPYWTLGTIFPAADAGVSFEASTSTLSRKTELLFTAQNALGVNLAASSIFYFYNSSWRKVGVAVASSFDDAVILPDSYFVVRNKTRPGTLTVVGAVSMSPIEIGLTSLAAGQQDNLVALARPTEVSLDDSGLITSGAFVASTSPLSRKDQLYVFDNSATGTNKSATAIYYFYNNAWRKVGQPVTANFGAEQIFKAGTGVIVRKAANGVANATNAWLNNPTY